MNLSIPVSTPRSGYKEAVTERQGCSFLFCLRPLSIGYTLAGVPTNNLMYQIIDAIELSTRWNLPVTWIREYTRSRTSDPIPPLRLGHYVRFQWESPELTEWLERHSVNGTGR